MITHPIAERVSPGQTGICISQVHHGEGAIAPAFDSEFLFGP